MSANYLLKAIDKSNLKIFVNLPESLVGRSPDCDIVIDNHHLSRVHARFYSKSGQVFLEDMESTNGTFLNNRQIHEAVLVSHGDVVKFGFSAFCFMEEANANATILMGKISPANINNQGSAIDEGELAGAGTVIRQEYPLPAQWQSNAYGEDEGFGKGKYSKDFVRQSIKIKVKQDKSVRAAVMMVSGSQEGRVFALFNNRTHWEIGRDFSCQIQLNDVCISNHHCRLSILDEGWSIEDLGSSNGVYLNGKRIQSAMLADGALVRLGAVEFVFGLPPA
ncbi:MAG: FHA domain-containing protein [Hahellaceae bacterium]|nr:FHA domain-containing protein [Hahellaceae bacterium]MCP5211900.1 FHA domain-containing protein [Hahellaceae bacterium]